MQTRVNGNIGGWVMLTIKFKKKRKEKKKFQPGSNSESD